MKGGWRWAGALVMAGAMWTVGCGSDDGTVAAGGGEAREQPSNNDSPPAPPVVTPPTPPVDPGPGTPGTGGTGTPDSGTPDAGSGNGTPDAGSGNGTPDAGSGNGSGNGSPDAGTGKPAEIPVKPVTVTNSAGWEFYGPQQGGPKFVYGVTADAGGNLWVAGGEEGLFLLKKGESTFRRFTMADGLRPYGFMRDGVGGAPPGPHYLKAISVAGGPEGTVFVGYEGKPPAPGMPTCEDEWDRAYYDGRAPDASVYKSGDADKVTLQSDGTLQVVHYDIHTGPNRVRDEMRGREKVCTIHRIAYDAKTKKVWFGGNHGFAMGESEFHGNSASSCFDPQLYNDPANKWDFGCAGVFEHVHPAINGPGGALLTDRYAGVAIADNGDVFFGGALRSTRFLYGSNGNNYWRGQSYTEDRPYINNRFDLWKDAVDETQRPTKEQRKDDAISGLAVASDGTLWVSSYNWGLAHVRATSNVLSEGYEVLGTVREGLANHSAKRPDYAYTASIAVDPLDGSVWAGARYGGGISRIKGGTVMHYKGNVIGDLVHNQDVWDIQVDRTGPQRRILFAFSGYMEMKDGKPVAIYPGSIGIYSGD